MVSLMVSSTHTPTHLQTRQHPCYLLSNLCFGGSAVTGLEHKDPSPSHAHDVAWAFRVRLCHILVLDIWAEVPKDISGFLDLNLRICAVYCPW